MINMRLINIHDVILIAAIAVIVHIIAAPLYKMIDGDVNNNGA